MFKSLAIALVLAGCWTSAQPAKPAPTPEVVVAKDLVQPMKIEKQTVAEDEDEDGVEGGEEGGVVGGVVGGYVGAPPPPPPPPPPRAPLMVAPTALEGSRISGDKLIPPDDDTKVKIARSGKDKIVASFKLCVADTGGITQVALLKSSGFPAYDQQIITTIQTTWAYRPYVVNGQPQPVCTAVTFIYSQH